MAFQEPLRLGVQNQRDAEGFGDARRGDVVMGRADPSRREHVIELPAHLVDGGDDNRRVIGDDPRLAQPDPGFVQPGGEKCEVGVLGAPGKDLVADDQDAGGHHLGCRIGLAHRILGKSLPLRDCMALLTGKPAMRTTWAGVAPGRIARPGSASYLRSGSDDAGRCRLYAMRL